ncbi:unnamed protein product [Ambrosiozyma monospora]|uniref:Methionyl-tRNA formyltransferase, mitochondrial n=1 Tax=Ambrosiozyma monospora TaxID=43982 RepID=A0A9W7DGZ6_AMBMO|nr:unnamed protein product [Ambrosiozyma monospora]
MTIPNNLLRIGFFGSDLFSITCLKAILPLKPAFAKLDVITRSPKPSGRGLTSLKDVPIATFAKDNQLNLLRADTKNDFSDLLTQKYNLCIAVSYGKLIPAEFLNSLKYGGLNVHPSLLPKYPGAAPLHRALLNHDQTSGVTVQTLHPTVFDKGLILSQKEYDLTRDETIGSLTDKLSVLGGELLREVLERNLYDPEQQKLIGKEQIEELPRAKKVKSQERQLNWNQMTTFDIYRRYNTLGPLYTFKDAEMSKKDRKKMKQLQQQSNSPEPGVKLSAALKSKMNEIASRPTVLKRVLLSDIHEVSTDEKPDESDITPGTFIISNKEKLHVKTIDGWISVGEVKVEGYGTEKPEKFIVGLNKKFGNSIPIFKTE